MEIKPITVLIGPNGSGKSSIIKLLLALSQTVVSAKINNPIVLSSFQTDLLSFNNLIFNHDITRRFSFGLFFDNIDSNKRVKCLSTLAYDKDGKEIFLSNHQVLHEIDGKKETIINVEYTPKGEVKNSHSFLDEFIERKIVEYDNNALKQIISFLSLIDNEISEKKLAKISIDERKQFIIDFLQDNIFYKPCHFLTVNPVSSILEVVGQFQKVYNLMDFVSLMEKQISEQEDDVSSNLLNFSLSYLISAYMPFYEYIRNFLANSLYFGPLRDDPQDIYSISEDLQENIGSRGEFIVEMLKQMKNQKRQELNKWLKKLSIAESVNLHRLEERKDLYEIRVKGLNSKVEVNFTESGFGVSQVLPILVGGLSATKESIILAEQPEIHLNPRIQSKLADFFIEMSKKHLNIIETHSIYFLRRLQRRIAEKKLNSSDVAIYYFNMSKKGSEINKLIIDDNGQFENWPKGFFEEDIEDSFGIAKAISKSRRENEV